MQEPSNDLYRKSLEVTAKVYLLAASPLPLPNCLSCSSGEYGDSQVAKINFHICYLFLYYIALYKI